MRTRVLLLCGALAGASAFAAEDDPTTRKAREEVERQLKELVKSPPPRLEILYAPHDELGYLLSEAEFTLDGQKLPCPTVAQLNSGGPQTVFAGEVKPGRHELISKLVFIQPSASVFTYMAGFRWKIGAKASFEVPAGLAMRVRALPLENPGAKEPKERLKLTHDSAVKMIAPPPKVALAAADAGAVAEAPPPPSKLTDESLEPEVVPPPKDTTLLVTATVRKKPVVVQLRLWGEDAPAGSTPAKGKEPLKVMVAAGRHVLEVEGKGLLAQTRALEVAAGAEVKVAFELVKAPKKAAVKDEGQNLTLVKPLRFSPGKAALLPDARAILAQVVDLVVRARIKKLKIVAHTDNRGEPAALQKLSQEQAEAVALALKEAGLDGARLEAVGLGDTLPKAPNLTPRGREKNRRVELIALER